MNSLKQLYKKLWTSLIRPERNWYSYSSLGSKEQVFEDFGSKRLDFRLTNAFYEDIYVSVFFPCNAKMKINQAGAYVIYCHTHSACRTEGLEYLHSLLEKGLGVVLFDFRANGISSARWVTLGYKEATDISTIVSFVKTELKAKRICLWGRSMGASATLFFLSPSFRTHFNEKFKNKRDEMNPMNKMSMKLGRDSIDPTKVIFDKIQTQQERESFYLKNDKPAIDPNFQWAPIDWVTCFVSDSSFYNLRMTIINMVKSKSSVIPGWLVSAAIAVIDKEIKKKTFISVDDIAPGQFSSSITTAGMFIQGSSNHKCN